MRNTNSRAERFTINQVAQQLHVHVATVFRWARRGVRGRRLKSYLIGGRRFVNADDLDVFLSPRDDPSRPPTPAARSANAQSRLSRYGLGKQPRRDR